MCDSGTHLNPCVTLGIFIAGEVRPHLAVIYVFVQLLGSNVASKERDCAHVVAMIRYCRGWNGAPIGLGEYLSLLSRRSDSLEQSGGDRVVAGNARSKPSGECIDAGFNRGIRRHVHARDGHPSGGARHEIENGPRIHSHRIDSGRQYTCCVGHLMRVDRDH